MATSGFPQNILSVYNTHEKKFDCVYGQNLATNLTDSEFLKIIFHAHLFVF